MGIFPKGKLKVCLALAWACLLLCPLRTPGAPEETSGTEAEVEIGTLEEESDIDLSLYYGYQNTAKSGRYLPVTISIRNGRESAIEGRIILSVEEPGNGTVSYEYEVSVPEGSEQEIRGTISVSREAEDADLILLDEEGRVLAEKRTSISIQGSENEILIGILSDSPQELSYFRGVSIANSPLRTRTVFLNPADFPETKEGLSQLDILLISNYSMRKLSEETAGVISEWVRDGGALLMGTGDSLNPLGPLEEYLPEVEIGLPETRQVNMGLQYSTEGPDGAVIELSVSQVYAPEGTQVLQSDDLAILTNLPMGNGILGITAYDLCDIRQFCTEQIGYTDALLQAFLGSARLQQLSTLRGEAAEEYGVREALVNLWDPERMPNISFYFAVALIYILLVGPGAYLLLRQRGLAVYYPLSVLCVSAVTALIIFFAGLGTNFNGPYIEYAAIREHSGEKISETEILSLSVTDRSTVRLDLSPEYSVQPVSPEPRALSGPEALLGDQGERNILIGSREEGRYIEGSGLKPFSGELFELYSSREDQEEQGLGLKADIHFYQDTLSGTLTNEGTEDLTDAALLMYGRIVAIGDIPAGETLDLSGLQVDYGPAGSGKLLSEYITELPSITDRRGRAYVTALGKTRLLSYYLDESLNGYYSGARLLAFRREESERLPSVLTEGVESHGRTLYIETFPVDNQEGQEIYRCALSPEPKVVSGEYEAGNNTTRGTASVILEYSLGNDLSVTALRFNGLSEAFEGRTDDMGHRLSAFRGTRALYNYTTSSYDTLSSSMTELSGEGILPYLSPSNTVTVRYIPDENSSEDTLMFLPVLMVTGVEN